MVLRSKVEKQREIEEQKKQYIYVYGIINNKDIKLDIKGLKDKLIKKINFRDISALTSLYPTLHPALKEDEAMQHVSILKKIAKKTTVIPMSFGTVFNDQEILETVLSKSYQAVKKTLSLIDDKIELGVKVVKQRKSEIFVQSKSKDLRGFENQRFSNDLKAKLSNNQLDNVGNGVALEILGSLNKLSVKSVKGDDFSDRLLLNHSFLVEKNKFSKFSEEIAKLENKYKDLKFLYTGPWPPYSFVNINIKAS